MTAPDDTPEDRRQRAARGESAVEMDKYMFGLLRDTEDRIEGRKAFREKRKPQYKGR